MNNFRRKWIRSVMEQITELSDQLTTIKEEYLAQIQDEEQEAYDNLPDGIRESDRGEAMDDAICTLEEAMDAIGYAIDNCEESCHYLEDVIGE